jgi:RNA:NAD 2'-phosphotransferase (TPT1/KptA family)
VSVDEMIERVRAMIADRNTHELDRRALEGILRMAQRGRHLSSTRLPAVSTAVQHFAKAQEHLSAGMGTIAAAPPLAEDDPEDEDEF